LSKNSACKEYFYWKFGIKKFQIGGTRWKGKNSGSNPNLLF
jgi:hypothetical protein